MLDRGRAAFCIVYLLALGVGSAFTASALWKSVIDYRPPPPLPSGRDSVTALSDRLVLVVLDGIRSDIVGKMKFLDSAVDRGASWTLETVQPSLSNPARAVLATGAWPEVNGVTNNRKFFPPAVDSIFSLARGAGLPTAAAGSHFWKRAFGDYLDEVVTSSKKLRHRAPPRELIDWQKQLCSDYIEGLRPHDAGLLVVGLHAADSAGHDFGGASAQYLEVARAVDACLSSLVEALDDGQTTFFAASDHGHIDYRGRGGHGGLEPEVTLVPLVAWGRAVRPIRGGAAKQVDVAPTICALLGLPLPAASQGRILLEAIEAPDAVLAELRSLEDRQRETAAGRIADPVEGRRLERRQRGPWAFGWLALFSAVLLGEGFCRPRSFLLLAAGAAVYYALYYAAFGGMGLGYSLSVVGREEYLPSFFGRNLAAGAGAFAVAGCVISRRARRGAAAKLILDLGIVVTASLALQVVVLYFEHGLFMNRFMPALDASFKALLDLTQLAAAAAAASMGFAIQRVSVRLTGSARG